MLSLQDRLRVLVEFARGLGFTVDAVFDKRKQFAVFYLGKKVVGCVEAVSNSLIAEFYEVDTFTLDELDRILKLVEKMRELGVRISPEMRFIKVRIDLAEAAQA